MAQPTAHRRIGWIHCSCLQGMNQHWTASGTGVDVRPGTATTSNASYINSTPGTLGREQWARPLEEPERPRHNCGTASLPSTFRFPTRGQMWKLARAYSELTTKWVHRYEQGAITRLAVSYVGAWPLPTGGRIPAAACAGACCTCGNHDVAAAVAVQLLNRRNWLGRSFEERAL